MEMGQKIYNLRIQKGLTLEELGNMVGVGKSTVRKWENGMIANMKRDKILKVSEVLDTTPAYLMGWKEEQPKEEIPQIIQYYDQLNEIGKNIATDRVKELTEIPRYTIEKNTNTKKTDVEFSEDIISNFKNSEEARKYLCSQNYLAAFGGTVSELSDSDVIKIANEIKKNNQKE